MSSSLTPFISYSQDSSEHIDRVVQLATRLRNDGVDVELDQWLESPPEGWPQWMERQTRTAKFVLVVCTETYNRLSHPLIFFHFSSGAQSPRGAITSGA